MIKIKNLVYSQGLSLLFIHSVALYSKCRFTDFSESDSVSFDGHASLFFKLSPRLMQASAESLYLNFKTMKNSGTIIHTEGPNEHSLTLELEKGRLLLLLRKGTTHL